ncbi:hypothetical protein P3T35_007773 [Kitasatospora sp. GP30]|nr:hypothetical protein [Kitasatospora sp. GP30]
MTPTPYPRRRSVVRTVARSYIPKKSLIEGDPLAAA